MCVSDLKARDIVMARFGASLVLNREMKMASQNCGFPTPGRGVSFGTRYWTNREGDQLKKVGQIAGPS